MKGIKFNTESFIEEAKKIFSEYDYSEVQYINSKTKIRIKCNEHGWFEKKPADLLIGKGCGTCGRLISGLKRRSSNIKLRYSKNHEEEYYEPVFTDGTLQKNMLVFCNICGQQFNMLKNNFLCGRGCPNCRDLILRNQRIFSKEQFVEKSERIHGKIFDYSKVDYKGKDIEVLIGCPICGKYFYQKPEVHWKGHGCSFCNMSAGESKIFNWLKDKGIENTYQYKYDDLRDTNQLSYDFFVEKYNLLIEFNGRQHYMYLEGYHEDLHSFHRQKHHDWLKRKYTRDNKINLLIIPFWEYENINEILNDYFSGFENFNKK